MSISKSPQGVGRPNQSAQRVKMKRMIGKHPALEHPTRIFGLLLLMSVL